jgi:RIO kinase 1
MGYRGDENLAAPTLNTVMLAAGEAQNLFERTLWNIEVMLEHGLVHGDLSAYNILYWDGAITLIDFPQVIEYRTNTNAYAILQRDIKRVCEYFVSQGVQVDPHVLANDLWTRHIGQQADNQIADASIFDVLD